MNKEQSIMKIIKQSCQEYVFLHLSETTIYALIKPDLANLRITGESLKKQLTITLNKYLEETLNQSSFEEIIVILKEYIRLNLNGSKDSSSNLIELKKLSQLLRTINSNSYLKIISKLIQDSSKLSVILSNIIEDNLDKIQQGKIEELTDNPTVICLLETYCNLQHIEIKEVDDNEELKSFLTKELSSSSGYVEDTLKSFLIAIDKPLLTKEEVDSLVEKMQKGNRESRNILVERNLKLVVRIAKRYWHKNMPLLDLIQEGSIGLIKATTKFDATRGVKFSSYATYWIRQSIGIAIANQSRTIRLPRHKNEELQKLNRIKNTLEYNFEEVPSLEVLSNATGWSKEKIGTLDCIEEKMISLNLPILTEEPSDEHELIDEIPSDIETPEEIAIIKNLQEDVKNLIEKAKLTPKEKQVLYLRYGLNTKKALTLCETGEVIGITHQGVKYLETKAIKKLILQKETIQLANYLDYPEQATEHLKETQKSLAKTTKYKSKKKILEKYC